MHYKDSTTSTVDKLAEDPVRSERRRMSRPEKIGVAVAVIGVIVALAAWLFPFQAMNGGDGSPDQAGTPAGQSPSPAPNAADVVGATTQAPGGSAAPAPAAIHLTGLTPLAGRENIVELPRDLRGRPGYEHAVVVSCPSNQSDDKVRTVTYQLRGRYLDFAGTVQPHFGTDREAPARVRAMAGYRERDDTMTREVRGSQFNASMAATAPLEADVERAEELTLQVECGHPDGVVILTDARLLR